MNTKCVTLSSLVDIKGGGTPSKAEPSYWNGSIPWASVKDFKGTSLSQVSDYITDEGLKNSAATLIPKGNLIIPTRMALGKVAINTVDLAINQDLKALFIKDDEKVDRDYLLRCIQSKADEIIRHGKGATVQGITISVLKNLSIPLPPLETQKQISSILEKAEQLSRDCQQMEYELNSLAQAVFIDMFGDPVTNPKKWETRKLSSLGELARGKSKHRPRNDPALLGGKYPLIQTGDVARAGDYIYNYKSTYSELGLQQSRLWPKGTLCITIAANIADTSILTFDACFPDSIVGFISDSNLVMTEFVHYWLVFYQKVLIDIAPESAQKNINLKILESLDVYIPPIELQKQFMSILESIQGERDITYSKSKEMNQLFTSLSKSAFKGELKIKEPVM
ncbi:restriction endonuclease subunit S [Vibrio natriegens]|uniref:restriction endonuclease subunit S n=1 Tax=Vibrio natriegens TaxID=691 RepID=UPI003F832F37